MAETQATDTTFTPQPTTTQFTYLLVEKTKGSGNFAKFCDVTKTPSPESAPPKIERRNLSSKTVGSLLDIPSSTDLEFGAEYDPTLFGKMLEYRDKSLRYAICLGDNGENGIFLFTGRAYTTLDAQDGGAVRGMTVSLSNEGDSVDKYIVEVSGSTKTVKKMGTGDTESGLVFDTQSYALVA